ncbi:proclotting enzyme-like [Choristoneura fumiferana]|uniref:proclotting enzyme-like n=1 Tax=Choristoneura fumiferana TaxID=7141 RepID=UPI003D154267
MPTAWIFVVILYTTQAFHHVNPTPATEYRVIKQLEQPSTQQPPQTTANQRDDEFKASIARVPSKMSIRDILSFHHGTLATRVPVDVYNNPLFGWHVTVYTQQEAAYEQICGGSLVKKDTAISAAHCFWDEAGLMPAALFAVTVGQGLRRWQDAKRYRSNVSEIIVPPRFLGSQTNFQDDIAVVRLADPVEYLFGVRPVCVDFDLEKARWHLRTGFHGLITGFGLTEENGAPSPVLNYQRLPYLDIRECIAASDPGFLKYLTSDKICAGDQKTGRALCRGDSGGGLVFFDGLLQSAVMYLRGVASAAPRNDNACNAYAIGSFTDVYTHRTFLRDHIPNLEEECRTVYAGNLEAKYKLEPTKPEDVKNGNKTGDPIDEGIKKANSTEDQGAGVLVNTGANEEANGPNNSSQAKPNVSNTQNENETHSVEASLETHKPVTSNDSITLKGPTKTVLSVGNGNNEANGLNEVKVKGNPNTNIFFFTGSVVDPSRFLRPNATPIFLESRAEQPTNIYVFIQN